MGSINLYRIDSDKLEGCLGNLDRGNFQKINTKTISKSKNGQEHEFGVTLYVEGPKQTDEEISWSWILNEFDKNPFYIVKAPKGILLIEEIEEELETESQRSNYAVTFGNSYFQIDKYCDMDFGFKFAARMEYSNIKTTTLTSPNLTRSKTVNTYVDYKDLDFNSGESFCKLKVNVDIDEGFQLFKSAIEIGNSIRFNTTDESIEKIIDIILYVEERLQIPDEDVKYKIPLFQVVRDEELLESLNEKFEKTLENVLFKGEKSSVISIPELEIIGTNEVFNHLDDEVKLKYYRVESDVLTHLTVDTIRKFCEQRNINTKEKLEKIKIVRYRNGEPVVKINLKNIIEYTDDDKKCVWLKGKWYLFNKDYLTYLNDSISEIPIYYKEEYDFSEEIYSQYINRKYVEEKNDSKYVGKSEEEIRKSLRKKYYAERSFNLIRGEEENFVNYDREKTNEGFERMDLYDTIDKTMFAVKKGKASSDLCYAIDQSLTSLKKYKHGEAVDMPEIDTVGLWFILERKEKLPFNEENKVDLSDLNMLMLKNRLDQWKKEVRLAGYKPIIYINYRLS